MLNADVGRITYHHIEGGFEVREQEVPVSHPTFGEFPCEIQRNLICPKSLDYCGPGGLHVFLFDVVGLDGSDEIPHWNSVSKCCGQ